MTRPSSATPTRRCWSGRARRSGTWPSTCCLLPLLIIAAGWTETNLEGYAVRWFGYELPVDLAEREPWAETAADLLDAQLGELTPG